MTPSFDIPTLATDILTGSRRALARAITLVESDSTATRRLMPLLYPHSGQAHVVGITGAPGVGKSTLVNALAQNWRQHGYSVGIIAVDPTSPFSGGALLGDRIRMQPLGGDAGVFVRSMASRGRLGGLAHATDDAVVLLDAAGFEQIIIETVGAGQSEIDVVQSADTTIVVLTPGAGDDIQLSKAGMLEIADVFVVNKADREGVEALMHELRVMRGLVEPTVGAWLPPILPTIALRSEGSDGVIEAITRHQTYLSQTGRRAAQLQARAAAALTASLHELILARAHTDRLRWSKLVDAIASRSTDAYTAAQVLLDGDKAATQL